MGSFAFVGASSLTTNLVASWKLADLTDSSGNSHTLTNNNSATFAAGKIGNAVSLNGSNQFLSATGANTFTGNFDWTCAFWFSSNTDPLTDSRIIVGSDSNSTGRSFIVGTGSNQVQFFIINTDTSTAEVVDGATGGLWGVGTYHSVIVWYDKVANSIGLQLDDRTVVTQSNAGHTPDVCTGKFEIGAREYVGLEGYWPGSVDNCNFWSRVLTTGERASFYNSGAGTEYPFGGGGSTAILTGAHLLTATQASFTLSGQATTLRHSVLTASQASFVLTGQAVALAVSTPAAQASFTLTGQSATLKAARLVTATQASFSLSGQSTTLSIAVPGAQALFTLTGQSVSFSRGRVPLTATQAGFSLSGQAITLAVSMSATMRTYTLTGQTVNFSTTRKLTAPQASFTLTRNNASLVYAPVGSFVLSASQVNFSITGESASLFASRRLSAAFASFVFTGESATFTSQHRLAMQQGAFALTGINAGLTTGSINAEITAGTGSFTLTGFPTYFFHFESGGETTINIPSGNRTLIVESDDHRYLISSENRDHTYLIPSENRTTVIVR
jgi:hypothetical protein